MEKEKVLLNATVCLLVSEGKVLLALKMKKIGAGCWNGYGGGIRKGETVKQAAIRELREESGKKNGNVFITTSARHLEKVAVIHFYNTKSDGQTFVCKVHFFIVRKWKGTAVTTDEMANPTFFDKSELPEKMMPADRIFLPLILSGKKIIGSAKYGPFQKELLEDMIIEEVCEFAED
jgi:ADP-ribose pyrophosphatase YjhB (NUDIX family)